MNLWLCETSCVDDSVSCDRSLTCEFPLSPSSQLMYESESLQDQCCVAGRVQPDQPGLETGVISPSVEGLMFTDSDVFQYMFANDQLPAAAAAAAGASSSDDAVSSTAAKYLSDAWKMTDSGGLTLTQLNSEDLDTTLLDDFSVSSTGFCVDCTQQQQLPAESNNTTSVPSTGATLPCWSEQMRQSREAAVKQSQQQQPVMSCQLVSSQRQVDSLQHCAAVHLTDACSTASSTSLTASATQLTLDRYWEAIDSFLKSEDARMAAQGSNHQQQLPQLATDIKTEAQDVGSDQQRRRVTPTSSDGASADVSHAAADVSDSEASVDDNCFNELTDFLTDVSSGSRKEKTYFWQYNMQSKGPKGKRLCRVVHNDDPYVLHDFEDPVFDTELLASAAPCYRHSGKARRGDGNDVTPNPAKLYATGKELRKLVRLINAMCPPGELPTTVRARTLREKNKYASRICRLKKKAQHEANKIKLYGLEQEHRQLTKVLTKIKQEICLRVKKPLSSDGEKLTSKLNKLIKDHLTVIMAGYTAEYVNSVLAKVAAGDSSGGLTVYD